MSTLSHHQIAQWLSIDNRSASGIGRIFQGIPFRSVNLLSVKSWLNIFVVIAIFFHLCYALFVYKCNFDITFVYFGFQLWNRRISL